VQFIQAEHGGGNRRLRLVFDNTVISINVAFDATLEDIARTFAKFSRRRYGHPVAIDITLAAGA
jgi:hypothetical protein